MRSKMIVGLAVMAVSVASISAQKPTPTPQMDSRGLPLPFGMQPYYKPEVPLGSGPYKAIMSVENGLSAHVAYYPANLSQLGGKKMPVLIWGNGSCLYAGNRYRQFLTEVALVRLPGDLWGTDGRHRTGSRTAVQSRDAAAGCC